MNPTNKILWFLILTDGARITHPMAPIVLVIRTEFGVPVQGRLLIVNTNKKNLKSELYKGNYKH